MALESSDPAMGMSTRGGGRRVCHGTAATAAGDGGGAETVAARGRLGRAARPVTPNVGACPPGHGDPNEPGVDAAVSGVGRAGAGKSDGQARGRGLDRVVVAAPGPPEPRRPAGRRLGTVAPVAPRACAEVVPGGTADRGDTLSGVSVVTVPTAGAVRESTTTHLRGGGARPWSVRGPRP